MKVMPLFFTLLRSSWQARAAFATSSKDIIKLGARRATSTNKHEQSRFANCQKKFSAAYSFGIIRGGGDFATKATLSDEEILVKNSSDTEEEEESLLLSSSITKGLVEKDFGGVSYVTSAPGRHRVIFVLGGPGAGKGTQCDNLIEHYKSVFHFSVGDLLRNASGPQKEMIESYLVAGKIVPVEISLGLLEQAMKDASATSNGGIFLVDGFPRNFDNVDGWRRIMSDCSDVLGVFVFDCPVEELERRILSRGETSGRSDDNIASARKRFATFEIQTMPVVNSLEDEVNVIHIEGDKTLDEVWGSTRAAMDGIVNNDVLDANQKLLDAIADRDWEEYSNLCDKSMLEAEEHVKDPSEDEESSCGPNLRTHFDLEHISMDGLGDSRQESVVSNAEIVVHGKSAVVSYDRIVRHSETGEELSKMRETRVWHDKDGWVNVHFVRKPL